MSFETIIGWLEKILLIPAYYDGHERELSIALTLFAALVGVCLAKFIPTTRTSFRLGWLGLSAAAFFLYWGVLMDVGGIFWYQIICRAVCLTALAYSLSSLGDGDKEAGDTPSTDQT